MKTIFCKVKSDKERKTGDCPYLHIKTGKDILTADRIKQIQQVIGNKPVILIRER